MFDSKTLLAHRLQVNGLSGGRLSHEQLTDAARPGLQDGSPRSGLLSLAARVTDVAGDDWRSPSLAQVFGPRGAVYLVPTEDIAVFTLGLLPRDPDKIATLRTAAAAVDMVLAGGSMRQADLVAALPDIGGTRGLRWAATLATIGVTWDTVDTIVHAREPGAIDPEAARLELARRFFRSHAPASVADLQWWLDGSRVDAKITVDRLAEELGPVQVGNDTFWTAVPIQSAESDPSAIHLLPPDDNYLSRRHKDLLVPNKHQQRLLWPAAPPPGAIIIGTEVAGTWRRRGARLEVTLWHTVRPKERRMVEELAASLPLAGAPSVVWRQH